MTRILPPVPLSDWRSRQHRAAALSFAAKLAQPGVWVEAGVADGWSARYLLSLADASVRLHAFDSFDGIPEAWNGHEAGTFAQQSIPVFTDPRITVHVGAFKDTMPAFARALREPIALLSVDCDVYASARTVLDTLGPRLVPGSVVVFDEALGSIDALDHEYRALTAWQRTSKRDLVEVARTNYTQLVMRVER